MTTPAGSGEVITFYSYKGGTGRSMLLANVAWILASNGHRVLAIDWDLEAPGLHRYFQPFLLDENLTQTDGVIDFVTDFAVAAMTPDDTATGGADDWFHPYADIAQYATPLQWDFGPGALDFVAAGRQGASYSTRVNSFRWSDFYERFGGGAFLERTKAAAKERYEYVLIDSRTGVSDTSGICTVQLPDTLVVCFTLNNQSVDGAAGIATSVAAARRDMRILPVPARIENSEKDKLELRRERARRRFSALLSPDDADDIERYWESAEVLYVPFYAYEEILATFGDASGSPLSILGAAERLTERLTHGEVDRAVRVSSARRAAVLAAYEGTTRGRLAATLEPEQGSVYISYRRDDAAGHAGRLYDSVSQTIGSERILLDVAMSRLGGDVVDTIEGAIRNSTVVLVVIGPRWVNERLADPSDFVHREVATALATDGVRVIPVLVGGASIPPAHDLPDDLAPLVRRQAIDLRDERWSYDVRRLVASLELVIADATGPAPAAEPELGPAAVKRAPYTPSRASEEVIDSVLKGTRESWFRRLLRWLSGRSRQD